MAPTSFSTTSGSTVDRGPYIHALEEEEEEEEEEEGEGEEKRKSKQPHLPTYVVHTTPLFL